MIRDGEYIATHEKKNSDIQHLIAQMVGREMKIFSQHVLGKPDENVPAKLEVKKIFPILRFFKEVSFAVRPGKSRIFLARWGPGVPRCDEGAIWPSFRITGLC